MNRLLLLLLPLVLVCSCATEDDERPVITVTIEPLRYFAEQIAGDKFRVVTMVPKGSSPETYEPTAQQMVELAGSQLYVEVGGLGFERTWLRRMRQELPHLIVVDASEDIVPLGSAGGGQADPHTWTSPANALLIARSIYRGMSMVSARDSAYFKANLDSLCGRIEAADREIRNMLENTASRSFVIYHPALTAFAGDYGLRQLAIEENGREPSAASLQRLIKEARADGVRLMFVQKEFASRNTDIVSRGIGAKVVEINPLSYDWDKEMIKIAEAICRQ